ncbi:MULTISPECIES: DUF1826 domain-containing protein [unclassified Aureispira]|uniref:DUF1826 domain-containing protein n=1 Tax=unclassified Aureispira TaxID=2649989 RepID=UPI000696FC3F|nr:MULTISPECIES: DUF1826 domain-containing protein [unclassified Aureispira]WMX12355.1 DUF1826 domain-containing protein [Aureispira sp. CCB-E]
MNTNSEISSFKNASLGEDMTVLNNIHFQEVNIAIYQRKIQHLEAEIQHFLNQGIHLKAQGNSKKILEECRDYFASNGLPQHHLLNDFSNLLNSFETTSKTKHFSVLFSTITTDLCSRFHADANKLRLLCTYHGPATLWLPIEAENRHEYYSGKDNEQIVSNPELIQQANTGDVLVLKGTLYPNAQAILHKSPSIEKKKQKRLLLRIDMTSLR